MKNSPSPSTLAFALTLAVGAPLPAQPHQLVKKWETAAELKTPESVLFDAAGKVL